MSWFKKNVVEVVEEEEKALTAVQAPLYRAMPKMELVEKLSFFEREIISSCTNPVGLSEQETSSYRSAIEEFIYLKRLWLQLEVDHLSDDACSYLYDTLFVVLPQAVEAYQDAVFDLIRPIIALGSHGREKGFILSTIE